MEKINRLPQLSHSLTSSTSITERRASDILREWEVGLRDGAIRLIKTFHFNNEVEAETYENQIGHFMRCSNLFVAVERKTNAPAVVIEIRMRPEYETAAVAAQIASECEREALVTRTNVRQSAA